jgi:hypothetical protein
MIVQGGPARLWGPRTAMTVHAALHAAPNRLEIRELLRPLAKRLIAANADVNKAAAKDHVEIIVPFLAHCGRTDQVDSFFKWNALKFATSDAARSARTASERDAKAASG